MILKIISHPSDTPHFVHHIFEAEKISVEILSSSDRNANLNNIRLNKLDKSGKYVAEINGKYYEFDYAYLMNNDGKTFDKYDNSLIKENE